MTQVGGTEGQTSTAVGAFGQVLPALREAFDDLQQHGWQVLTDLRLPGRSGACIDAVLVGPGGVVVLESTQTRRRQTVLSSVSAAIVALVPAELRRHVQAVVCPPAERGDASAVSVKPSILAAFMRSLPQVMTAQRAADVAQGLRDALAGPVTLQLWTVSKVLEWTKDAKGEEPVATNRKTRRAQRPTSGSAMSWIAQHALLVGIVFTAVVLAGIFAR